MERTRRDFLRLTGLAAGSAVLAACGDSGSGSGSGAATNETVAMQLSWIKNIEFAGEYLGIEKGYYAKAGITTVDLLAGGAAGTSAESSLVTGRAWIGVSAPLITAPAVLKGAALKIVAATFQKNPFCVVSLEKAPIPDVKSMIGKRIGVQDSNDLVFNALLKANNIEASQIKRVPFQFDPTPITTGQVDGYMGYATSGAATLASRGFPATQFLFADNGLRLVGEVLVVKQETIDSERDKLKGFLKATVQGWKDAVADPAAAAQVAVTKYGKDQNLKATEQEATMKRQATLIESADTKASGLLTISDELVQANIDSLRLAGIDITADKLFDTSVLKEVFAENPDLV